MRQRRLMNQINVVPYIDVMLVLLVIFMVTAPMIQTGSVNLPSVGKMSEPPVAPLEVIIHADQSVALMDRSKGDKEVRLESGELAAKIRAAQQANPQQSVLIAADRSVRYEAVLNVMDELQKQQITKIGLLVHPGK
ncbi:MAG: protein TolR [Georgfuchsia sp.]